MNKHIDTKVFLRLQETKSGFDLYINNEKQEIIIKDGEIQNKLKKYQMNFIKDYIKLK